MTDLTVVILTKNEEKNLRKCVESFRGVAKRFVIVDSFSTDSTEALCKELNAELQKIGSRLDFYQNKWVSYADQLNWGLQNTDIDTEWSMRMDADEEIMEDLAAEINEKLPQIKTPVNGVILRRRVYFMGRWIKHGGRYPELLLRIFRTGMASCEMKIMDEHMILSEGMTVEFKHDLIDNNQIDLEWWTAKHNWYSNREVLDHQMTLEKAMDESLEQDGTSSGQAKMKRVVKNSSLVIKIEIIRTELNRLSSRVTLFPDSFATSSAVKVAITATRPIVNAETNIFCRIDPRSKIQQNAMLISICIKLA